MPYFVPLGIPDFKGNSGYGHIETTYTIEVTNAIKLTMQVRDGMKILYEEHITDPAKLTVGNHVWQWDGFDANGILDTDYLTSNDLNIYSLSVDANEDYSRNRINIKAYYNEVRWVDVRIDKNTKRIDVTLRVNLQDGGEIGTEKDCIHYQQYPNTPKELRCPWDKIPKKDLLIIGKKPIKKRTKNFKELEALALEGLRYHWGRNRNHHIAKNIHINGDEYEVYINPINTRKRAMDDVSLVYNTNNFWGRSNNPGDATTLTSVLANIAEYIPYIPLNETIYYNIGYVNFIQKYQHNFKLEKSDWRYLDILELYNSKSSNIDKDFSRISAHELGHNILKAYAEKGGGSTDYSYKHKGTSTYSKTISVEKGGKNYPTKGEIDLMQYYNNRPEWYDFNRIIASNNDILGLLWLSKLELKEI